MSSDVARLDDGRSKSDRSLSETPIERIGRQQSNAHPVRSTFTRLAATIPLPVHPGLKPDSAHSLIGQPLHKLDARQNQRSARQPACVRECCAAIDHLWVAEKHHP